MSFLAVEIGCFFGALMVAAIIVGAVWLVVDQECRKDRKDESSKS